MTKKVYTKAKMCYNLLDFVLEDKVLTIREELDLFVERADDFIESKYILADIKIVNLLKAIASSETLLALFKNCLTDFDYYEAQKKYLVKNRFQGGDKGEFILPPNSRELLAFIFNILVDIDAKNIELGEFINKYFFVDGSFSSGYDAFVNAMIKPFRNSVKILMENVLAGSLQDPVEALVEQENKRREQEEKEAKDKEREKALLQKAYGASVKAIKDMLLLDKQKIKNAKLKEENQKEIILVIDMLANALESEDKEAIFYAFVAYKYVAKSYRAKFRGRVKRVTKLIGDVFNGI